MRCRFPFFIISNNSFLIIGFILLLTPFCKSQNYTPCDFKKPSSRDASWSPDSKKLVYTSNKNGQQDLYIVNINGENDIRLTNTPEKEYYPFFSPNGKKVVYFEFINGNAVVSVIGSDGKKYERLTPVDEENADPSWSPDGKRIVFYSERDGNRELYIMNVNGKRQTRITHTDYNETTPVFSKDGTKILCISNQYGWGQLSVIEYKNPSKVYRVTNSKLSDRVARWSPNGQKIVFYSRPYVNSKSTKQEKEDSWAKAEIEIIDANGENRKKLTKNNFLDQGPAISPDGKKICFTSCASGNREVFIMDNDGTNIFQLTKSN